MKIITKYSLWLLGPVLCAALLGSCKKNNEVEQFKPSRAFVPTSIVTTPNGAQVKIDWKASLFSGGSGITYTVQLSRDANFGTVDYSTTTSATTLTLSDEQLLVGQPYYVRIRANGSDTMAGSIAYVVTSSTFTMPGILQTVANSDLTSTSVNLKWLADPAVTKITITPASGGGAPFDVPLTADDVNARSKLVTGLKGDVSYRADIYGGSKVKGFTTFKTPLFNRIISATDNLIEAINNAANGDIIGLNDGVYDTKDAASGAYANITVVQKRVTLQGVSGDPAKVTVNFKQIDLKGSDAGISVKNITFDGAPGAASYFINLTGVNSDAEKANFSGITIDGCNVSNAANALIRGNRGAAANDYTIGNITINNSQIFNINQGNTGFNTIELTKLQFARMDITNSTFYDFGRSLVVATTALAAGTPIPVINIDKSTFNYFGGNSMNVFVDANTNPVLVTVQNSIIANTPKSTLLATGLIRATGAGSVITINNNNTFNLNNGSGGVLSFPSNAQATANGTVALDWTATTKSFTLPTGSSLRTASNTGGPIGDPRWAK